MHSNTNFWILFFMIISFVTATFVVGFVTNNIKAQFTLLALVLISSLISMKEEKNENSNNY